MVWVSHSIINYKIEFPLSSEQAQVFFSNACQTRSGSPSNALYMYLLSVFALIETICLKIWVHSNQKMQKLCPLSVDVRLAHKRLD